LYGVSDSRCVIRLTFDDYNKSLKASDGILNPGKLGVRKGACPRSSKAIQAKRGKPAFLTLRFI